MGKAHIMLRHVKTCGTTNGQEPSPIRPRFFLSFRLPVRHNLVISSTLAGRRSKPRITASVAVAGLRTRTRAARARSIHNRSRLPPRDHHLSCGSCQPGLAKIHLVFSWFSLLNWHIPLGSCTSHLPTTVSNWMSQGTCSLEPLATSC